MPALGIDFGTSTSVVAVCHVGRDVEAIPNADGDEVIPSVVAFTPAGKVVVGKTARSRRLIDPPNAIYSVKRILGRGWHAQELRRFKEQYPFELEEGRDGVPHFVTRLGKLTAVEVVSYIMAHLREYPGVGRKEFENTVISVPASATPEQRKATLEAAERAGYFSATAIAEPHAAALPYMGDGPPNQTVAVYDLGGGTFDVAILFWNGHELKTVASGGDPYLGGDDIDQRCTGRVADRILEQFRWDVRTNTKRLQTLNLLCEQAKIRLSVAEETAIGLGSVDEVLAGKMMTLTRAEVEELCADLLQRTFVLCDRVLSNSGIKARDVDVVVVAGGGAYMPAVRSGVEAYFGQKPRADLHPDRVVALGAALHAEQLAAR